ncbi:ComEC/Rec2 family competence protein [Cellulomonas sp. C5510]|uniref:ComEC/Rec2 family competence protein n=1 Tax=Cellulomonas sp. C5510 TaxID=2871170 RepID=UPI001C98B4D9|nr:ComEC/Rec2 family competence protein [Cellulomonas sp. C5510]QZN86685.1 ComEC/Rec2 family competence protein [Cellulomonas sp. C5510]
MGVLLLTTAGQVRARESGDLRALAEARSSVRLTGVVRSTPAPLGDPSDAHPGNRDGSGRSPPSRVRFLLAVTEVVATTGRPDHDGRSGGHGLRTRAAVEVVAPGSAAGLRYGTVVTVLARLVPARHTADRAVARARATVAPRVRGGPPAPLVVSERLRAGLGELSADLPGDAGRLLPAVAVGDTRGVGDLEQAMRDSGLAHLTAVSGAHFSLLGAVVLALAARLHVPRRWRWLPTAAVMAGFVALVHPAASVVRAAVMGGVGLLGLAAGRPSRTVPALGCAVVVLLVVDPWLARDLGFVLSVVATAGIAVLAAPLAHRWRDAGSRAARGQASWLALACAVPVAAQAVCAPVVLLLSPQVPVYSVPANLLAAPAVAPATVGGLVAAVLGPWWPDGAAWAAGVAGAACWWIAGVARTAAGLPGSLVTWAGGPVGVLLLAAASAASVVLVLRCRRRVAP